ncbi:MAG: hypothetical protein PHH23_01680 [Paludibacteraceae bacterium]|nr:hypothetical protein [Paludibacteraceae bacterium]
MGFFSWKTQDTNRSIANRHSCMPVFNVIMTDNKGNQWEEDNYDGYGVFGGKDYYELLAEMNGLGNDRSKGIKLAFSESIANVFENGNQKILFPSLSEDGKYYDGISPEICECQGFFY